MDRWPGSDDVRMAARELASRLPEPLGPLARVAYNYYWSWAPGGAELFAAVDPHRWELCGHNPVRLLEEADRAEVARAARDEAIVRRARELEAALEEHLSRPPRPGFDGDRPVAFFCAEYGVHESLPIYSGGLGVLAGDVLKQASDAALPMVGIGLLYRYGYFHQRVDLSGYQHEYWVDIDAWRLPPVPVTDESGEALSVSLAIWGRQVSFHVWRVDVGRVPLYLLDAEVLANEAVDRWITGRLYDGNRSIRLAQYAALGVGGVRMLRSLGVEPSVLHLNEGHASFAGLELAAERVEQGASLEAALEEARRRVVFTTHTPVAAGNETYPVEMIRDGLSDLIARLGAGPEDVLDLGRLSPGDQQEPLGLTPLSIRMSRRVNGVSRRHASVARGIWQGLYPGRRLEDVPIDAVTNGVHLPSWMSPPFQELFDRHLGPGWRDRADDPSTWEPVASIPDRELWAARNRARRRLIERMRARSVTDRLRRGENIEYVQAAARAFDPDVLTLGFARRLAAYKRLHLLTYDPGRALRLLEGDRPVQLLFAGKAHPQDDGAKRILQAVFHLKSAGRVAERVAFLEDYDIELARDLVAGCDVWVNLPRPPLEASGTSGMKSVLNGGVQLSTMDGWWYEAFDGQNGWAIDGEASDDERAVDAQHAERLYGLLESEVLPLFYDRDADGVPRGWAARMKASIQTLAPRFSASRMLADYAREAYLTGS